MRTTTTCSLCGGHRGPGPSGSSVRFCPVLCPVLSVCDVQAAPPEAPAAQRAVGPPLCRLSSLLQRLSSRAARCPGPQHLPGLLPSETRTPAGPVLPCPAQRRPQPAVRQRRHEPGEFRPGPVCPGLSRIRACPVSVCPVFAAHVAVSVTVHFIADRVCNTCPYVYFLVYVH